MSFMDKIKSFFSGGEPAHADAPAASDPIAEPMGAAPAADPAGMPTTDAAEHLPEHDEREGHDHD